MLKRHVTLRLQSDASPEDIGKGRTLLGQSIHDWSARRRHGSLQHETEDAEHGMEAGEVVVALRLPLNARHHLGNDNKVNDERRRQQRVFAHVEDADGLVTAHEDLAVVFVQGTLVVAHSWHVLDDDAVVRMLACFVQDIVSSDHVVNNIALGDFLGAELLLRREILAVVVAEVVIARD